MQETIAKTALPEKLSFRIEGQMKNFPDKKTIKGVRCHQTVII